MLRWKGYQVNGVGGQALGEDFGPGVRLDLGELELSVIGVHCVDVLPRRRPQHLHATLLVNQSRVK